MEPVSSESPTALTSPAPPTRRYGVFRFMYLPAELRVQVYEELVVVGKVFYTPTRYEIEEGSRFKDYKRYRKPSLQILRVSKEVRAEAEDVYLTKNLFVLPHLWYLRDPSFKWRRDRTIVPERLLFSASAREKIKHISFAVCNRTDNPLTMTRTKWDSMPWVTFDDMTADDRIVNVHDELVSKLDGEHCIFWLSTERFTSLESLEVDYTNSYCPSGCCRQITFRTQALVYLPNRTRTRVLGLRDEAEKTKMLSELSHSVLDLRGLSPERIKQKYGLKLNPIDDPWEKYLEQDD